MQNLKIYIFVEDEHKANELRIDGNLNTLRDFLSSLIFSPIRSPKDGESTINHILQAVENTAA